MARGSGRRTYVRDGNGRFASTGTTTAKARPAARRAATRAGNRLNRDNAGRISGIGRNGATVRGGRLKTAKGNARATQTASMRGAGFRAGTIAKGGRGVSGRVARSMAAVRRERAAAAKPAAGSVRTVNRTRAEAAAAYKKRIRPARAAAARMAPADKPVSSSRPDGNLILGRTWEQIQAAQKGAKRALDGGPITGKAQKPRATQGDRRLLAQKGMKGLKAEGLNGVLDRLRTSKVRIGGKPKSSPGIRKLPSAIKPATPAKPTAPKRTSSPRPAGTVAKPKGLKAGALATRRAANFPRSMRGKNVDKNSAFMAFMDRAQALSEKRKKKNDYNSKRTAASRRTSAKAQEYISRNMKPR